jgi:hypothetical protein
VLCNTISCICIFYSCYIPISSVFMDPCHSLSIHAFFSFSILYSFVGLLCRTLFAVSTLRCFCSVIKFLFPSTLLHHMYLRRSHCIIYSVMTYVSYFWRYAKVRAPCPPSYLFFRPQLCIISDYALFVVQEEEQRRKSGKNHYEIWFLFEIMHLYTTLA